MGETIQILVTGCAMCAALIIFIFAIANPSYVINNQLNLSSNSYDVKQDLDFFKQIA
jgi:hypothetical protein